jgi:hypothetical protein
MLIHHVTMLGGADRMAHRILSSCLQYKNFLIAADELEYKLKNIKGNLLNDLRKSSSHLILDSGVLGAAKKGCPKWILDGVEKVPRWGQKIKADRIAHVDIPSEPEVLKMLGVTVEEAREITVKNAYCCLEFEELEGKRIISVQGWTLDDRKRCLEMLYPIIDRDKDAWVGNGSTCMLTPKTGLYKFYEWLHSELPDRHIHAWGIANSEWLANLYRIGISSADSGTAGFANGMNEEIHPITGKRTKKGWLGKRNSFISALGFIKNMEAIEQSFETIYKGDNGLYTKDGKSRQVQIEL